MTEPILETLWTLSRDAAALARRARRLRLYRPDLRAVRPLDGADSSCRLADERTSLSAGSHGTAVRPGPSENTKAPAATGARKGNQ